MIWAQTCEPDERKCIHRCCGVVHCLDSSEMGEQMVQRIFITIVVLLILVVPCGAKNTDTLNQSLILNLEQQLKSAIYLYVLVDDGLEKYALNSISKQLRQIHTCLNFNNNVTAMFFSEFAELDAVERRILNTAVAVYPPKNLGWYFKMDDNTREFYRQLAPMYRSELRKDLNEVAAVAGPE